ncbi:probable cytochrome P450 6a14 [Periplaneta americana]|uniref:probable cytochrome P450 6a14 n=1 Tax=Periplaneta americana TaxID=6978 RepID=UPI0037E8DA33
MLEALQSYYVQLGTISALILAAIYVYFKVCHSYWQKLGVPTLPTSIPFGNFQNVVFSKKNPFAYITELYNAFEGHKIGGIYRFDKPSLILRDPEVIKQVLVKDFDHFYSRGATVDEKKNPLLGHVGALSGSKWKNLRVKLSPTFTSGKMKIMFGTLVDCGKELQTCLETSAKSGEMLEMKDLLARYSTDIIGSCAFGIQCNSLSNPDAEFRNWGRKIFMPTYKSKLFRLITIVFPSLAKILNVSPFPKDVSDYFMKMVRDTVAYREKNDVKRNDFMQLLIQLKNKTLGVAEEEDIKYNLEDDDLKSNTPFEVTLDVMAAQAFVFFLAGFETSSTTMTFCLYELAVNQDIQERLREEIDSVLEKNDGEITYDSIFEMEYLDKVVNETLRKYPPAQTLTRERTKTTKIRGTNAVMEKGMQIMISIMGLHHDPKYYPDPEKFDPERFSEEEKSKRPHFSYLPFGEGPRICIGMRFGLMQTKVGIISLLSKYEVHPSEKTSIPLVFDSKALVLAPEGGMWLKIVARTDK